jgi:hypothetical protein
MSREPKSVRGLPIRRTRILLVDEDARDRDHYCRQGAEARGTQASGDGSRTQRSRYLRSVARGPLGTLLTRKVIELIVLPPLAALKWISCHSGRLPSGAVKMVVTG